MGNLEGHLGYLNSWAKIFPDSVAVQEVCVTVHSPQWVSIHTDRYNKALCAFYQDLITFCQGARKVFIGENGKDIRRLLLIRC